MLSNLAWKELRETTWIAGVALLAFGYQTFTAMGVGLAPWHNYGWVEPIPFVHGEFTAGFGFVAFCLAMALGFRQSVGESAFGTYLFLLHRPASRLRLIGTKLAVGLGLCLVCSSLPILGYAFWAATPGTHPGPFEWSMTAEVWKVWLAVTIVYFGAVLSGIRPGRWYGTRLLPLVGAGVLAILVASVPWTVMVALAVVLIIDAALVAATLFAARQRDYP